MGFSNENNFNIKNLNTVKIKGTSNTFKFKSNNVQCNKLNTTKFDKDIKSEFVLYDNNRNEVEEYDLSSFVSDNNINSVQTTDFVQTNITDTFIEISNFTDKQNSLILQFAYLNFDIDGVKKYIEENGNITISQLRQFLLNEDSPYMGSLGKIGGIEKTCGELLDELVKHNLGNLKIIEILDDNRRSLNAIVFEDSEGNKGFTFKGTDVSTAKDLLIDAYVDVFEGANGYNLQIPAATELFNKHKNANGNNYLFGHSLGGNIVYHLSLNNINDIEKSFIINGTSLGEEDAKRLENTNAQGKITAVIIEGDSISKIKDVGVIEGVNYIVVKSNNENPLDHVIESAMFNDDGSYVLSDKTVEQEMEDVWAPVDKLNDVITIYDWVNNVRIKALTWTKNTVSGAWNKFTGLFK